MVVQHTPPQHLTTPEVADLASLPVTSRHDQPSPRNKPTLYSGSPCQHS